MSFRLSRRSFLTASVAASSLLLPILRSSRAYGQTATTPRRLVFFHTPLGTVRTSWAPTGTETSWSLSPVLQPLAPFKDKLLVVDGLQYAPEPNTGGGNHKEPGSMLTGRYCDGREEESRHSNISLDQWLRTRMPTSVPVKSLELLTMNRAMTAFIADRHLFSARGPNLPVIPEADPQKAFDRVFAGVSGSSGTTVDPAMEALRLRRKSVLDTVNKEIAELQPRLSGGERTKLDMHMTAIRDLESRLQAPASASTGMCTLPGRPTAVNAYDNDTLPARLRSFMDIVAVAMACDLIRVAVIGNENGQGRATPRWLGYTSNWHDAYTHGSSGHAQHTNIHNWYAQQFAYLAGKFKAVTEGTQTMLDNSALVMFSEQGCRYTSGGPAEHSRVALPYVVAGSGGGYFKQNAYVKTGVVSHKEFLFNCIRAMGLQDTTFGNVSGTPIASLAA